MLLNLQWELSYLQMPDATTLFFFTYTWKNKFHHSLDADMGIFIVEIKVWKIRKVLLLARNIATCLEALSLAV